MSNEALLDALDAAITNCRNARRDLNYAGESLSTSGHWSRERMRFITEQMRKLGEVRDALQKEFDSLDQ